VGHLSSPLSLARALSLAMACVTRLKPHFETLGEGTSQAFQHYFQLSHQI
jgi:hypothetical protein